MPHANGLRFTVTLGSLPAESLVVVEFTQTDTLNTLSTLSLALASRDPDIDLAALLGAACTLTVWQDGAVQRRFHGILTDVALHGRGHRWTRYQCVVRPPLWRLAMRHNCRIFQAKSVVQIAQALLAEHRITGASFSLRAMHPVRPYCVQYRETDLAFLLRLCAQEGITVFHDDSASASSLVFTDHLKGRPQPGSLALRDRPHARVHGECAWEVHYRLGLAPSSVVLQDYAFTTPHYALMHTQHSPGVGQQVTGEHYDFPGDFQDDVRGKAQSRTLLHALRRDTQTARGQANAPWLAAGAVFTLTDHPRAALNDQWQLVSVTHRGEQPQALEEDGGEGATVYDNHFEAVPASQPWCPPPLPKPRVEGPHPGVVVGPYGEQVHCDEHGRVKVQFHWDREGRWDDTSSCWVRVSQGWAGRQYGSLVLPRVGHEVLIAYLEGDPDQPFVIGSAYHATHRPPYPLPLHQTRTVLRTDSVEGDGFHEVHLDDRAGQEQFGVHAQRNMLLKVGNDLRWDVAHDWVQVVTGDQLTHVQQAVHETIEGDANRLVKGDSSLQVDGDVHAQVGGSVWQACEGHAHTQAGKTLVLDAGEGLTLKVGGNFITLDRRGITVSGNAVNINSGGRALSADAPAPTAPTLPEPAPEEAFGPAGAASA